MGRPISNMTETGVEKLCRKERNSPRERGERGERESMLRTDKMFKRERETGTAC